MTQRFYSLSIFLAIVTFTGLDSVSYGQALKPLSDEQRATFEKGLQELQTSLNALPNRTQSQRADAAIFHKGLEWALKYDREFSPKNISLLQEALARGRERVSALSSGKTPWNTRKGKHVLGYVSRVDGSIQPYGVIIPKGYNPNQPMRLDVVLHGSSRPVGLSELRFMSRFDEGDGENPKPPENPYIELHPLGRVENCYRWAGETDVFEAIEDASRRYNIDQDRIVLRGMSMGASGTWHLGLKHPDKFVALGPYCGYVDTHRFSETPLKNFIKVGPLPDHQELGLHMLDSVDYAANAGVVPSIACIGEKDVFFQAHVIMGKAMQREGLKMVNIISPGTGHKIDPVTHAEQLRRIRVYSDKGLNHLPHELRFVTWTLKYSRCHWIQLLGLKQHYARAEISARLKEDVIEITTLKNITRFAIRTDLFPVKPKVLRIDSKDLEIPPGTYELVAELKENQWQILNTSSQMRFTGKRPGLQGPIDDAFSTPFLCVRGTGKAWNKGVQQYADAALERFANEWHHYFRGTLPTKNDTDVTEEDLHTKNLILFGDPGSNPWIAKALPHLPLKWSKESLNFSNKEYDAQNHLPALITANPLKGGENRYLVLNSGHTFREKELASLNYLLFPRWGDWAILKIDSSRTKTEPAQEKVLRAGYFDEAWNVEK